MAFWASHGLRLLSKVNIMKKFLPPVVASLAALVLAGTYLNVEKVSAKQSKPTQQVEQGIPWMGQKGITVTVADMIAYDRAHPQPDGLSEQKETENEVDRENLPQAPGAVPIAQYPPSGELATEQADSSKQADETEDGNTKKINPTIDAPQTIGTQFDTDSVSSAIPPDTVGCVGPSGYLAATNQVVKYFNKAGAQQWSVSSSTFWNSVRNGSGTSDPHVVYDRLSGRFFLCILNLATPNRILVGVSNNSNPTTSSSFTFYFFQHDTVGTTPNTDTGGFADYPTLGVDANALYIGDNVFNAAGTAFLGCTGFVIRKSSVTTGGPIVVTAFRNICTSGGAGIYTPQGATNNDPAATEGYFVGTAGNAFSRLYVRRVTNPGGTPSISGNLQVGPTSGFPTTSNPRTVPQSGSGTLIDGLDDRLLQAMVVKNALTGVSTLWTAHQINVTNAGVATGTANRNGIRWYEIKDLATTPTLAQAGTLFDASATSLNYWMGTIAASGQGHAAIGSSVSGSSIFASTGTAGRLSSDSAGLIQTPVTTFAGLSAYTLAGGGRVRWGDYSATYVDPVDDMTMWTAQEYAGAGNTWRTRVTQLIAPPPADITNLTPNTINQGQTTNIVVTGTSVSGSGFYESGDPNVINHIAAAFSGTGVTVNSIVFNSPTQLTLNVTASAGAALGARNLTVTNPDGQAKTKTSALTVNNPVNTVSGTLTLEAVSPIGAGHIAVAQIFDPAGTTVLETKNVTLASDGSYSFTTTLSGAKDIRFKITHWLAKRVSATISTTTTGVNASLLNGDADQDNLVSVFDYGIMSDYFDKTSADSDWSTIGSNGYAPVDADMDEDGVISVFDYGIISDNFDKSGDD